MRANDADHIYKAICEGLGKGLIPEVLGETNPELIRISGRNAELTRILRLIVHPEIRRQSHVAVTVEWLGDILGSVNIKESDQVDSE